MLRLHIFHNNREYLGTFEYLVTTEEVPHTRDMVGLDKKIPRSYIVNCVKSIVFCHGAHFLPNTEKLTSTHFIL
jgi:hypothetical protein